MTQPTRSTPGGPDVTIDDLPVTSDLGYPGMGYGDAQPLKRLLTFDEMLPATRAFYRRSSKT